MKDSFETYGHELRTLHDKAFRMLKIRFKISMYSSGIRNPSTKLLQRLTVRHQGEFEWLPKTFKASRSRAQQFRKTLQRVNANDKWIPRRNRIFIKWCRQELTDCGKILNSKAKERYAEIFGMPPKTQKAWGSIRKLKKNLRFKTVIEKIGTKNEYVCRQIWRDCSRSKQNRYLLTPPIYFQLKNAK